MNQDPVSRTRDLHGAIGGATVGKKSKMPHEMLLRDSESPVRWIKILM